MEDPKQYERIAELDGLLFGPLARAAETLLNPATAVPAANTPIPARPSVANEELLRIMGEINAEEQALLS